MTTQTQQKVYSYDDLIQDICKDPAGIHNLGHGTTQGYLRKDGKFIRRDRQTGKNKVYDFGKDFANSYGKLQGFDKNGMAPISINSQGLVPLEYKDQDGKSAITFMAGPKGAKINGHGIGRGKTTGWYKVDDKTKTDLYNQFNFHGKGHKGITTYVDRDSELESNFGIPQNSNVINSDIKIRTDHAGASFNNINAKDSNLFIIGNSFINKLDANNVQMDKPGKLHANSVKLDHVALGSNVLMQDAEVDHAAVEDSDIVSSSVTGGHIENDSDITDSKIRQNAKSRISKTNMMEVSINNDNLNAKELDPETADPDAANVLNNVTMNHSVIHTTKIDPALIKDSSVYGTLAINGLTAENSELHGREVNPLVLDGVIADKNKIHVNTIMPKIEGILNPNQEINDLDVAKRNIPAIDPQSPVARKMARREVSRLNQTTFVDNNDFVDSIEQGFGPGNLLSNDKKRDLIYQTHPEVKFDPEFNPDDRAQKAQDPTDDL